MVAVNGESVTVPGAAAIDAAEVVELARALIRIDTSNPPGNEQPGMLHLGADLERSGIEVEYVEVEPERANLFARLPGEASSGHVHVVAPGDVPWNHDPFAADMVGDGSVGRGASDTKGDLAAMAVAMATLACEGFRPAADLILAVCVGEEVLGRGARHMALRATTVFRPEDRTWKILHRHADSICSEQAVEPADQQLIWGESCRTQ